jgi:predicted enzyme related to lactoylglutathione lyase
MSERDGYEHGVPNWVNVMAPDPAAAADFYGAVFGWEMKPEETYFIALLRGREVASISPLPPGRDPAPPAQWMTQVAVDDVDSAGDRAVAAGGTVVAGPLDFPTHRMNVISDPTGATFCTWEARTRKGAQLVNEAGAYAMSRLDTPDPERAAAFYRELFGWTTETFEMGENSITMFRLPGYVGGEPSQPVSREVVATMAPAPEDTPPKWTVDFWSQDVDAAVRVAEERGGRAVQGPFDIPIGRNAVLADPAGATFSISWLAAAQGN